MLVAERETLCKRISTPQSDSSPSEPFVKIFGNRTAKDKIFTYPIGLGSYVLPLTSSVIGRMIRRMCKRILAALLIVGWVSLSGFDLLEDLVGVPSGSPDYGSTSKRVGWVPLVNNIVQSAHRTQQADMAIDSFIANIFAFAPILDFRRHSQLHKLFHVFLI